MDAVAPVSINVVPEPIWVPPVQMYEPETVKLPVMLAPVWLMLLTAIDDAGNFTVAPDTVIPELPVTEAVVAKLRVPPAKSMTEGASPKYFPASVAAAVVFPN